MNSANGSPSTTTRIVSDWKKFFIGYKLPHPPGKPDKQVPLMHRVAHVLDWVARKAPGQVVPYNVIYKEINGLDVMPRMSNDDVQRLRARFAGLRGLLRKMYKRDLVHVSGVGLRATVDDDDVVRTTTPAAVRRYNSATEGLKSNAALVNVANLSEGRDKTWFTRAVSPAIKALSSDDRLLKLLPPAPAAAPHSVKPSPGDTNK
jgi:hypothetical protein